MTDPKDFMLMDFALTLQRLAAFDDDLAEAKRDDALWYSQHAAPVKEGF